MAFTDNVIDFCCLNSLCGKVSDFFIYCAISAYLGAIEINLFNLLVLFGLILLVVT